MTTPASRFAKPLGLLSFAAAVAALAGACATGVADEGAELLADGGAGPAADAADAKTDVGHPTVADAAADAKVPTGDDGVDANPPGDDDVDATPPGDDDAGDAGVDTGDGVDAGHDAGFDAGRDAGHDAGFDAGHDAGFDSGFDSGFDAGPGQDAGCTTGAVVLNEVQVAGPGGAEDEWVEIRNGGSCPLSLTGWTLKHTSTSGTTEQTVWTGGASASIAGHGYAVVAGQTYTAAAPTVGAFGTGVLAATGGGLGLYDSAATLRDSMGYGVGATNPFVQGGPAPVSPTAESMARTPDGASGGDNSVDFVVATSPTPGAAN